MNSVLRSILVAIVAAATVSMVAAYDTKDSYHDDHAEKDDYKQDDFHAKVVERVAVWKDVKIEWGKVYKLKPAFCPGDYPGYSGDWPVASSAITGCACYSSEDDVVLQSNEADAANGVGSCVCAFKNVGNKDVYAKVEAVALCLQDAKLVGDIH